MELIHQDQIPLSFVALFEHLKSILHVNAFTSHVYSIFVDESIDQTMEQHLIVYCCHLGSQGRSFQMKFSLKLLAIDGATSMIGSY
jgi:hypothetical protein